MQSMIKHNSSEQKEVTPLTLTDLYDIADSNKISVYHFPLYPLKSISTPGNIGIDVDQMKTSLDEKEHLAHELGHCMKYAFYTGSSPYELRSQKEYRANKWAIEHLVPYQALVSLIKSRPITLWELAEHFNVSESFMKKVLDFYSNKLIFQNRKKERKF